MKNQTDSPFQDFLHPKSMLTPGIAGALTMAITNALSSQFGLWPNYTGLVISFLFGLLAFRSTIQTQVLERWFYYVLNSLIIFTVAVGTNQSGVAATGRADTTKMQEAAAKGTRQAPFFANWLDGTVPRREQLVSNAKALNEEKAKEVLSKLMSVSPEVGSATNALESVFSTAKTGEDIYKFELAYEETRAGGST